MEILLSILIYFLVVALAVGMVWLIVVMVGTEKMKKITIELRANKELAVAAVRYAQQVYWNLDGPIRYEKAMEWMIAECQKYGIKFTIDQLDGLIHEALRAFKDEFGEQWGKATAESEKPEVTA